MSDEPLLSNIRDFLGWVIGRRVVDVTAGDPPSLPDSHGDGDGNFVVLHFDNGGTLNVLIGGGFSYNNPVSDAADRGELCEDCMSGKRHIEPTTALSAPTLACSKVSAEGFVCTEPPGHVGEHVAFGSAPIRRWPNPGALPGYLGVCDDPHTIDDWLIGHITAFPRTWAPRNPHYSKNHVNAPGTVRQWFRKMRAADFARDIVLKTNFGSHYGLFQPHIGWTFFDTQTIVDRETASHYLLPDPFGLWGAGHGPSSR